MRNKWEQIKKQLEFSAADYERDLLEYSENFRVELAKKLGRERVLMEIEEKVRDWEIAMELELEDEEKRLRLKLEKDFARVAAKGKFDDRGVILRIHAGEGGDEACDWTQMLLRMYEKWANRNVKKMRVLDWTDGGVVGYKSIEVEIDGNDVYGVLKGETGVHRLVRVSPFDAQGRRHTSFAAVQVLPLLDGMDDVEIKEGDVEMQTFRSGGPGGQHQNKTESGVRLIHRPTGLVAECREERSQIQNREKAWKKLEGMLVALEEEKRAEEIEGLKGEQKSNQWGSQIRSYVFMPHQLVRDERTGEKWGDLEGFLEGKFLGE